MKWIGKNAIVGNYVIPPQIKDSYVVGYCLNTNLLFHDSVIRTLCHSHSLVA